MKVIRHAGVDNRMIIFDNQARQQNDSSFQNIQVGRKMSGIQQHTTWIQSLPWVQSGTP